jgi:hypothetical protein
MVGLAIPPAEAPAGTPAAAGDVRASPGVSRRPATLAAELLVLLGLLLVALQLRLANVEHYSGSFDEGIRMQQLLLMELGFRPFRDIFASQGPLLLDALFPLYLLFGQTLGAARLGVSALSMLGIVGAWWALRPFHPLAGLAAASLLTLSPGYLENSRLALAEVPSLTPCLWAVGCAVRWQRGGRAAWLVAAGLLGAVGVLVKPMALPIVAPLAALALLRRPLRVRAVALAVGAAALLAASVLAALDLARVVEVLGGYRGGAQGSPGADLAENLLLVRKVLAAEGVGFLALAAVGAGVGLYRRSAATALLAWPLVGGALFAAYTDLADKHVVYLVPPLALLGGLAVGALADIAPRWRQTRDRRLLARAALGLLALASYAWSAPRLWHADRELRNDADERARRDYVGTREQADLIAAVTSPSEFVLTDNPIAAYYARRPVPPWLVDTSGTRVEAGSLTPEVAIREAERFRPVVVGTVRRRLGKLDGFERWLQADYRIVKTYGTDAASELRLYVRADREGPARAFLAGR